LLVREKTMKVSRAAVSSCVIALAIVFVLVGVSKIEGASALRWKERLSQWGYPASARHVIGTLEIIAGIGLLIPASRRVAAAAIVALMIGALATHLVHGEMRRIVPPIMLAVMALFVFRWGTPA
jgi:uncharacterized membrane protein YphA (DoxX/SURF4 family)